MYFVRHNMSEAKFVLLNYLSLSHYYFPYSYCPVKTMYLHVLILNVYDKQGWWQNSPISEINYLKTLLDELETGCLSKLSHMAAREMVIYWSLWGHKLWISFVALKLMYFNRKCFSHSQLWEHKRLIVFSSFVTHFNYNCYIIKIFNHEI